METKITDYTQLDSLEPGELFLIDFHSNSPDEVIVLSAIHETYKYPVSKNGKDKHYMATINGKLQSVYAKDNGETGDEMTNSYNFISGIAGDYCFDHRTDVAMLNLRHITKDHPLWDDKLSNDGKQFGNMMNIFAGMLKDF